MVSDSQLFWAAGDRLVFPWERDGWQHLYSVAVEGGKVEGRVARLAGINRNPRPLPPRAAGVDQFRMLINEARRH